MQHTGSSGGTASARTTAESVANATAGRLKAIAAKVRQTGEPPHEDSDAAAAAPPSITDLSTSHAQDGASRPAQGAVTQDSTETSQDLELMAHAPTALVRTGLERSEGSGSPRRRMSFMQARPATALARTSTDPSSARKAADPAEGGASGGTRKNAVAAMRSVSMMVGGSSGRSSAQASPTQSPRRRMSFMPRANASAQKNELALPTASPSRQGSAVGEGHESQATCV